MRRWIALLFLSVPQAWAAPGQWSMDSKELGESRSDFRMVEVERRPQSSVLQMEIKNIGASVDPRSSSPA